VENGGSFVGFCAGAYYASSTMRWEGNLYDYPLGLFPGEAAGPYFQWGSLATIDLNPKISFNQDFPDTLEMWYFGGPCFTGFSESDVDILARYHANGEAAVIAFNLAAGGCCSLVPTLSWDTIRQQSGSRPKGTAGRNGPGFMPPYNG